MEKIILKDGREFVGAAFADRVDSRDFDYSEFAMAAAAFNWEKGVDVERRLAAMFGDCAFKIPTRDQGAAGSCGGQAGGYYGSTLEAITAGKYVEKSAKFIYSQFYVPGGGMYLRDIFECLKSQGDCNAALLPDSKTEEDMQKSGDITSAIRAQAKFCRIASYAGSVATNIDTVANAIDANNGAILLVQGSNNGTWDDKFPVAPKAGDKIWGHFLYASGAVMIDGIKYIKVINSWGDTVGEDGRQYLSEDYFKSGYIIAFRTAIQIKDKMGWVADKYLKDCKTTENLRLRSCAGLSGKTIVVIPKGTLVETVGFSESKDGYNWVKVQVL